MTDTFSIHRERGAGWAAWYFVVRHESGELQKSRSFDTVPLARAGLIDYAKERGMEPTYSSDMGGTLEAMP